MIIAQFSRLRTKAQICHRWYTRGLECLKTEFPLIFLLVLELELECLVLEIGQSGFGGDVGVAKASGGTAHEFILFAVVVFIVSSVSIADHGHYVGEDGAGAVVLVSVKEDTETLEFVDRAEDVALGGALFGYPHGEAVAMKVTLAVDLEFDFDLEKGGCDQFGLKRRQVGFAHTSQFVAVSGTREKSHPEEDG